MLHYYQTYLQSIAKEVARPNIKITAAAEYPSMVCVVVTVAGVRGFIGNMKWLGAVGGFVLFVFTQIQVV